MYIYKEVKLKESKIYKYILNVFDPLSYNPHKFTKTTKTCLRSRNFPYFFGTINNKEKSQENNKFTEKKESKNPFYYLMPTHT